MSGPGERLLDLWRDVAMIGAASAVLSWDQETYMPPKGQQARGRALSTLAGIRHEKLTSPEMREAIEEAASVAERGSVLEAQVREADRHVTRAAAIPPELARELASCRSRCLQTWQAARSDDDFSAFAPDLRRIVSLTIDAADALVDTGLAARRYDALIDEYEPGATEEALDPLLSSLRDELSPLVREAADSRVEVDETHARGDFPPAAQEQLGRFVAEAMGYDFEAGRLDESAHPFTTSFGHQDVRITWRWEPDDFRPGLFGVMHETGHALYEQGLPAQWEATPIGDAVSLGVHESQSRLWENLVGRSRPFWEWALPAFIEHFPAKAGTSVDDLWPALHAVKPSPIRVEADEATYNLHIVARFEIERDLIAGKVDVDDLVELWDHTYEQLLGIRPPSAADGVLQDIHWAMGAFGYFPTYTLGNLISAQLFAAARREIGDLDDLIRGGELRSLLAWLRERVHQHGSRYPAPELVEQATGRPLDATDWLTYICSTTEEVYSLQRS